jgi:hypothetical protein
VDGGRVAVAAVTDLVVLVLKVLVVEFLMVDAKKRKDR